MESDLLQKGIRIDDPDKIFTFNPGEKYIYGDILPKPQVNFYSIDTPERVENWRERYDHHTPGISRNIKIRHIVKKISGSKNDKQ